MNKTRITLFLVITIMATAFNRVSAVYTPMPTNALAVVTNRAQALSAYMADWDRRHLIVPAYWQLFNATEHALAAQVAAENAHIIENQLQHISSRSLHNTSTPKPQFITPFHMLALQKPRASTPISTETKKRWEVLWNEIQKTPTQKSIA